MTDKEKQEQEALDEAAKGAMDDLDEIEKSLSEDKKEETDIADLEKAIAETEEGLKKSDDEEGKKGEEKEEEEEDLDKSLEGLDPELAEELVKASEAYASLEKSVNEQGEAFDARLEGLEKAVRTLTRLSVGQAKVIASLTKSLERVGEKPMKKSQAQIGDGGKEEPMKKSRTEVKEVLEKAVREKKEGVPGNILSFLDAYGVDATLARIPEATLGELGLK